MDELADRLDTVADLLGLLGADLLLHLLTDRGGDTGADLLGHLLTLLSAHRDGQVRSGEGSQIFTKMFLYLGTLVGS